nr:hypothetical protein [Tanacetum cinerariifolium]
MNYQPVIAGNQTNPSACFQDKFDAEKAKEEIDQQYVLFPMWSSGSTNPQNNEKDVAFDDKEHDLMQKSLKLEDITYSDDEDVVGAEDDFNNLESSVPVSPIPTTIIYKDHHVSQIISDLPSTTQTRSMKRVVKDQGGLSQMFDNDFHTCMFARFLSQEKPKREEGIDYEEVFAPVAKIEAIILFLAYASFMDFMVYQIEVKSTFLYGIIEEEVYVYQPPGFKDPDHPDKNDIIFGATNKDLCKSFEMLMKDKFQMSSMRELTFFLGLQVKQKKDGIFISQDKYVAKILRKFGLTKGKLAGTPIDTEKPFLKDPDGEDVDVHTYRSMIGSLMYLASSRPNIMFAYKKQTVVDTSSTEAEYVAAASDADVPSQQELDMLFGPLYDEFFNACSNPSTNIQSTLAPSTHTNDNAEENNNDQAEEGEHIQDDEFTNPLCTPAQEVGESSSHNIGNSNVPTFNQPHVSEYRWTKDHLLEQAAIREVLRLDDAEGVDGLPNEEIFAELAHMGYEKPSTKLTFYKAFFSSQWKFLIHTILQSMSAKRTLWNEFSSAMASTVICLSTGKGFSWVETPLFEGMIVGQVIEEGGAEEEHVEDDTTTQGDDTTAQGDDTTAQGNDAPEPSIPSPTPPTLPPQQPQDIPSTSQVQHTPSQSPQPQPQPQPQAHQQAADFPMSLLQEAPDACVALTKRVEHLEYDKVAQALEITKL